MKNKLYVSLFALVASSAITVTGIGDMTQRGVATKNDVWGFNVAREPNFDRVDQGNEEKATTARVPVPGKKVEPKEVFELASSERDFLRNPKVSDNFLSNESLARLSQIEHGLSRLSEEEPEIFNKYFGTQIFTDETNESAHNYIAESKDGEESAKSDLDKDIDDEEEQEEAE
ncbi:hypothetical protein HYV10_02700 [Candidatus Dependentiae bacterium]|nr:hypothetical protein [Candidatus Dependentiae bacterium]